MISRHTWNTCCNIKLQLSWNTIVNKSAQSFRNLKCDNVAQVTKTYMEIVSSASSPHPPTTSSHTNMDRSRDMRIWRSAGCYISRHQHCKYLLWCPGGMGLGNHGNNMEWRSDRRQKLPSKFQLNWFPRQGNWSQQKENVMLQRRATPIPSGSIFDHKHRFDRCQCEELGKHLQSSWRGILTEQSCSSTIWHSNGTQSSAQWNHVKPLPPTSRIESCLTIYIIKSTYV